MRRRGGWKAAPEKVTRTVWGPHPEQISEPLDALFALDLSGTDRMRRPEHQSAVNGTRANGDLGNLQPFDHLYGFQPQMIRASASSSLPSANSGSAASAPLLAQFQAPVG